MKKTKLLMIAIALIVLSATLSSCFFGGVKVTDFLNADYETSAYVYTQANEIVGAEGYSYVKSNGYLAVFQKLDETTSTYTYRVISLSDGIVVDTYGQSNTAYSFNFYGAALVVTSVYTDPESAYAKAETAYTLFDGTGSKIATSKYSGEVKTLNGDFVYYDGTIYETKENGKLVTFTSVPEYVLTDIDEVNDNYFYSINSRSVVVYDHAFNYVSSYEVPGYAKHINTFILNNGDILVQYFRLLDSHEDKYDLLVAESGSEAKYEVETLLVSAETGKATNKSKLNDYMIYEIMPNYELCDAEDDNSEYTDTFDNIIVLAPIVNKNIDASETAMEIRYISNRASLGKSVKVLDDMAIELPEKVSDGIYMVGTISGLALIDENGKVLNRLSDTLDLVGEYFVGKTAIYDTDLEMVYDIRSNNAELLGVVGDSIIIKKELYGNEYEYLLFHDGKAESIYNDKPDSSSEFVILGDIGYAIVDTAIGETRCFNTDGTLLLVASNYVETLCSGKDLCLVAVQSESVTRYYVIK